MACKDCGKPNCTCGKDRCAPAAAIQINNTETVLFRKVSIPASAGDETTNPPKPGAFCNALVYYEATGAAFLYSSDGIPTRIDADVSGLEKKIDDEVEARTAADQEIWTEIETIEASSDVVDVVGTYADLEAYDTSKLHRNDLIKVLQDETRDDAITYYRWSGTAFTYVGAEGPYYTASETDTLLAGKQDTLIAGSGISIASDGKTISATTTAANTIFYMNASESGSTRHIYKNPDMTGLASSKDVFDANELGQVILRISTSVTPDQYSDCYLQNAYKATGDYQLLFLDERTYRAFDTTNLSDTSFYYSTRVLQTELTAGTNIQINGATISATDTTYSAFTGATSQDAGTSGLVPAPATTDVDKYLKGDGTWGSVPAGGVSVWVKLNSQTNTNDFYSDASATTPISLDSIYELVAGGSQVLVTWWRQDRGAVIVGAHRELQPGVSNSYRYMFTTAIDLMDGTSYIYGYKSYPEYSNGSINQTTSYITQVQPKLTAGANISIATVNNVPNTISVTGMPVLYTTQGQNIDGAVTQKLFTDTVGDVESILQTLNSGNGV